MTDPSTKPRKPALALVNADECRGDTAAAAPDRTADGKAAHAPSADIEKWRAAALKQQMTLSDWIRRVCRVAAAPTKGRG